MLFWLVLKVIGWLWAFAAQGRRATLDDDNWEETFAERARAAAAGGH